MDPAQPPRTPRPGSREGGAAARDGIVYERARFDQQIGESLLKEVPEEWCAAVLVLRIEEDGTGTLRCRQAVRGPGGSTFRPGPGTRAAVGELIEHLALRDDVFRGANYAVAQQDGESSLTADFTYDDKPPRAWSLPSLAEKYALVSCARQLRLKRRVKHAHRDLDLRLGELRYPEIQLMLPVLLMGTTFEKDATWHWGWVSRDHPLERCIDSTGVHETGLRHGVPELMSDVVPLDASKGHIMAAITSSLTKAAAYVRVSEGACAQFVAVYDDELAAEPLCTAETVEDVLRATFDTGWVTKPLRGLKHGIAMVGGKFAGSQDGAYVGELVDGTPFRCELDEHGKLAKVVTT